MLYEVITIGEAATRLQCDVVAFAAAVALGQQVDLVDAHLHPMRITQFLGQPLEPVLAAGRQQQVVAVAGEHPGQFLADRNNFV